MTLKIAYFAPTVVVAGPVSPVEFSKIFNLSEMEFKKIQREIYYDKSFEASIAASSAVGTPTSSEETAAAAAAAGAEETPEETTPEETPAVPVTELPAALRRDDKPDMRSSMSKKTASQMRSEANPEGARRNTYRTMIPGYDKLSSLYESTNYDKQKEDENEIKLHEVNQEIKNLLTTLENKDANETTKTKI